MPSPGSEIEARTAGFSQCFLAPLYLFIWLNGPAQAYSFRTQRTLPGECSLSSHLQASLTLSKPGHGG